MRSPQRGGIMFDSQAILQRLGGDRGLLNKLIDVYLAEAPKLAAEARDAIDRRDWNAAGFAAHNLRGLAANLGFSAMGAIAESLERLLSAAPAGGALAPAAERLMQELTEAIEECSEELQDYLRANP